MDYAVIKTGGKQYRVSEGDVIEVDKLPREKGAVTFDQVLLTVSDKGLKIGKPFIRGEIVSGTLLEQIKGEKIRVAKFKSKVRYRRVSGFRALLSKVKIEKIGNEKGTSKAEKPKTLAKKAK
jgi:large subunit ribosomal protein L21